MNDSSNENGKTAALAAEFLRKSVEDAVNSAMEDQFASFFEDCASGAESPRNGYYERKIITMAGVINARMPRDRFGLFKERIIGRYSRRIDDFDAECTSQEKVDSDVSTYRSSPFSSFG